MAYVEDQQIYGSVLDEYESAFGEPLESQFINVFLSKNSSKFRSQKFFSLEDALCKLVAIDIQDETTFVPMQKRCNIVI